MLAAALDGNPAPFDKNLFAFFDLAAALKLQLKWINSRANHLPLVVARDDRRFRTTAPWQRLAAQRQIIFIAQRAEPRLFRQACLGHAQVYIDPHLARSVNATTYGDAFLRKAHKYARPWERQLSDELRRRSADEAARFLEQIKLPPAIRVKFLNDIDSQLIDHLRSSSSGHLFSPACYFNDTVVFEQGTAWITEAGAKIAQIVRIEQILHKRDGTHFLQGFVCGSDESHAFIVPELEARTLGLPSCLRKHICSSRVDLTCKHGWARHILGLALATSSPKTQLEADTVGWRDLVFSFPNFGIGWRGFSPDSRTPIVAANAPAQLLTVPMPLDREQIRELTWDWKEVHRFWAIVIATAYHALAAPLRMPPIGVILFGADPHRVARTLSRAFGCFDWLAPKRAHAKHAYHKLHESLVQARWPVIVECSAKTLHAGQELLSRLLPAGCFVPASDILWLPTALAQGWHVIECDHALPTIEILERFGQSVLLHYLNDAMGRRLHIVQTLPDPLKSIGHDVAEYLNTIVRGRPAVHAGQIFIWRPTKSRGHQMQPSPITQSQVFNDFYLGGQALPA